MMSNELTEVSKDQMAEIGASYYDLCQSTGQQIEPVTSLAKAAGTVGGSMSNLRRSSCSCNELAVRAGPPGHSHRKRTGMSPKWSPAGSSQAQYWQRYKMTPTRRARTAPNELSFQRHGGREEYE